ncbi:MAG: hypothetical protein U5K75_10670 [Ahrensia sp.]|nr:hypothetical protein [Ahrensia sp.]
MEIKLKGVHKVSKTLADGSRQTYYFAWRGKGAPRMMAAPGTPEFAAEYERLTRHRRVLGGKDTVDGLIALYRASPAFTQLQGTTRSGYDIRLQVISKKIGSMPVGGFAVC